MNLYEKMEFYFIKTKVISLNKIKNACFLTSNFYQSSSSLFSLESEIVIWFASSLFDPIP